ncbi:MAG: MSMEG_1061 family FMN-dependent PPOX-type flavoprotein [Pseudomonadota bacterium]
MPTPITTLDDLLAHYGEAVPMARAKETAVINDAYRRLIQAAPFFAVASIGPEGMDCSPRGDGPGCVQILDDHTVAFADRRGNNRLDTLRNIVVDPRVALLFLIPGWNECLRINGQALVTADADLLDGFVVNGQRPVTAVVVRIDTMYFQCARAIKRAGLWDAESRIDPANLPKAGELVRSVVQDFDAKTYDAGLQERQAKTLY